MPYDRLSTAVHRRTGRDIATLDNVWAVAYRGVFKKPLINSSAGAGPGRITADRPRYTNPIGSRIYLLTNNQMSSR